MARKALFKGLFAVTAVLSLASCAGSAMSRPTEGQLFDREGIDVILTPADTETVYFKDPGSQERYCRSPESDTASTVSEGVSIGSPVGAGSVGKDASRGSLSLGGRNPAVLIAREFLYRACELSLNLNADSALTLQIYERFLKSIEEIAKSQTGTGVAATAGTAGDTRIIPPTPPPTPSPTPGGLLIPPLPPPSFPPPGSLTGP